MLLSQCPLFAGIEEEEVKALITKGHYQYRSYEAETLIANAGQECKNLMILTQGSVRAEMVDTDGRAIKIEDLEAAQPLAPAFIFGQRNLFPVTIIANEDTEVLVIPRQEMVRMMQQSSTFLVNYLNSISSRAQFLSGRLNFLSMNSIKGKIARYLLEQQAQMGNEIRLAKSQNELASLFGVARPSLTRELRELHNRGIIDAQGKIIIIKDINQLRALLR